MRQLLPLEVTPEAIKFFVRHSWKLTDYGYWFFLSTLWVSYTGWSNLGQWRLLFSSDRPKRHTSIMKPSEVLALAKLPPIVTAFRAHRPGEKDWIAYTISPERAAFFAKTRGVEEVSEYRIPLEDILCLFLRRGEFEVLVLDQSRIEFVRKVKIEIIKVPQ